MNPIYLLIALISFSFIQDDNFILWKANTKLTWAAFKGTPNPSSPYKAQTNGQIKTSIATKGNQVIITITTFFDKSTSWTKDQNSKILLAHEQLHFDMVELWARKFRQQLQGKTFSVKIFQEKLNDIQNTIYKQSSEMQNTYDTETKHSEVTSAQQKWQTKIATELQKLNTFSNSAVTCTVTK